MEIKVYNSDIKKKIHLKNVDLKITFTTEKKKINPFKLEDLKISINREVCESHKKSEKIDIQFMLLEYYIYGFLKNKELSQIDQDKWVYYPEYWLKGDVVFLPYLLQSYVDGIFLSKEVTQIYYYKYNNLQIPITDEINEDITKLMQFLSNNYGFGKEEYFNEQYQNNINVIELKI